MEALNLLLSLISKTQGRDKTLRFVQYATLYSKQTNPQGSLAFVYNQMRSTRKVLRFLRTLQYLTKIRDQFPNLKQNENNSGQLLCVISSMLQNIFGFLFYICDHIVFLSEVKLINESYHAPNYKRSYYFYLLENIFGVIKNILEIALVIKSGKQNGVIVEQKQGIAVIKRKTFDLLRCLIDVLVSLFFIRRIIGESRAGVLGVMSSVMGILQSLNIC